MPETNLPFLQTFRNVKIKNSKGKEFNITSYIQELSIYEELFSNTLSGELVFVDSDGAADTIEITGNERLTVEIYRDDKEADVDIYEFYVYSANNRLRLNPTSEIFSMHFISVESTLNEHTRVYSAINGTNDNAIKELLKYIGTTKKLETEETSGSFKYVMPSWTPFEGINWYCGRSVSSTSKGSYFLFYETLKGFNFKSVESLITQPSSFSFHHSPAGTTVIAKDVSNIKEFEVINMGDSLKGVSENYTTLWSDDLLRKKITKNRFEFSKDNKGKLNDALLAVAEDNGFGIDLKERRDVFGSNVMLRQETRNTHTQTKGYSYDSIQPKLSAMRQFSNLKIRFLAYGNRKMKAGDVIDLNFLHAKTITKENKETAEDKLLSGKYLITAIRYIFKVQDFHIAVEAVKDTRKG
jgi:hypothetical protein